MSNMSNTSLQESLDREAQKIWKRTKFPRKEKQMSDTPRTDAEWNQCYDNDYGTNGISQEFAQHLERELNEANARLKQLQEVARLIPSNTYLKDGCICLECELIRAYDALPNDVKGKANDDN